MKRFKRMLLLLLALGLCVGGYFGAQLLSEKETVTEESGVFQLEARTLDDLAGLKWQKDETDYAFSLSEGVWTVTENPAFPLDQTAMQDMAEELLAIAGTRQLDGVTNLADYGLAEPGFTVTASWSDGASTIYALGDETPFGDGYYLTLGEGDRVYTIEEDLQDVFDTTLNDLAVMETLPELTEPTRLTVSGTLDAVKEEASRSINENERWYDSLSGAALDTDAVEDLVADVKEIAWAALTEPTASDEALKTFGLDDASAAVITAYEGETAALTLLLGAQNEEGDYYTRLPGSTMVYTVADEDVSALLSATTDSLASMTIIDLAAENVQEAVFTAGEYTYAWKPEPAVSEEAEEASDEAADETSDEAEAPVDPGKTLWESLLKLEAESRIDAAAGQTLLVVEATAVNGQSTVLTFAEHDAEFYAVTVADRCFLVDAAPVDAMIRSLRAGVQ